MTDKLVLLLGKKILFLGSVCGQYPKDLRRIGRLTKIKFTMKQSLLKI